MRMRMNEREREKIERTHILVRIYNNIRIYKGIGTHLINYSMNEISFRFLFFFSFLMELVSFAMRLALEVVKLQEKKKQLKIVSSNNNNNNELIKIGTCLFIYSQFKSKSVTKAK